MALKVLIAGGSVSGLTLALILQRTGIEFEVLEKGDFAPQLGASIGIQPQVARILDQLGVWDDIAAKVIPLRQRKFYDAGMKLWDEDEVTGKLGDAYVPRFEDTPFLSA